VRIGYLDITNSLPLYVAMEKNLFKSRGLEAELSKYQTSNDLVEALIAGRIDAEVSASTSVLYALEVHSPGVFKVFSVNVQTKEKYPDNIIVRSNSPITTMADLKGKKLGTFPGSTFLATTRLVLRRFVDPAKVTIEQLPPPAQVEALTSGAVDAIFTMDPFGILAVEKAGGKVLESAPTEKYVLDPLPGGVAAFSATFLKSAPGVARKVAAVFDAAIDSIRADETGARSYLPKYTSLSADLAGKVIVVAFWKSSELQAPVIQAYADTLTHVGDLPGSVDAARLLYRP
jgi:NitT/TauT family transport system substrate-binding protein